MSSIASSKSKLVTLRRKAGRGKKKRTRVTIDMLDQHIFNEKVKRLDISMHVRRHHLTRLLAPEQLAGGELFSV